MTSVCVFELTRLQGSLLHTVPEHCTPPTNTTAIIIIIIIITAVRAATSAGSAKKMPRLDENTQQTLRDAEQGIRRTTATAWESFSNFALRDNVLEVAVGLMYINQTKKPSCCLLP